MRLLFAEELKLIKTEFDYLYFFGFGEHILAKCLYCEDDSILRNSVEMLIYESQHIHGER